jgi:hypothetical protein
MKGQIMSNNSYLSGVRGSMAANASQKWSKSWQKMLFAATLLAFGSMQVGVVNSSVLPRQTALASNASDLALGIFIEKSVRTAGPELVQVASNGPMSSGKSHNSDGKKPGKDDGKPEKKVDNSEPDGSSRDENSGKKSGDKKRDDKKYGDKKRNDKNYGDKKYCPPPPPPKYTPDNGGKGGCNDIGRCEKLRYKKKILPVVDNVVSVQG